MHPFVENFPAWLSPRETGLFCSGEIRLSRLSLTDGRMPTPSCPDVAGQVLLCLQAAAATAAGGFHLFAARRCINDARPDGCGSGIADLHGQQQQQQQQQQQLGGALEILGHKRLFVMRLRGAGTKEMEKGKKQEEEKKKKKEEKKKKKKKEFTSLSGWSAMQDDAGGKQGRGDGSSSSSESEDQGPPDGPVSDSYVTRYTPSSPPTSIHHCCHAELF